MANPANVEVIIQKLVAYLKSSVDIFLRKDLVPRIISLAERLAPSNIWCVALPVTLLLFCLFLFVVGFCFIFPFMRGILLFILLLYVWYLFCGDLLIC